MEYLSYLNPFSYFSSSYMFPARNGSTVKEIDKRIGSSSTLHITVQDIQNVKLKHVKKKDPPLTFKKEGVLGELEELFIDKDYRSVLLSLKN